MKENNFFSKIFQHCEGKVEIRPLPGKPGFFDIEDVGGIAAHCDEFQNSNLYFGVATRDGQGGSKANVVDIPCLWCDLDFKITPHKIVVEKLKKFPFKPSMVVQSGGGIHLYWMLREPVKKSDIATTEDVNHRIADQLGGDHASCDAARILRIPGTLNRKYSPARLCEVAEQNDFFYSLDDFLGILPEPNLNKKQFQGTPQETDWLAKAMQGVSENRNSTGTKIAGYFINKVSPSDVLSILRACNLNNKPPLDEKEIETIAKSVSRYQPNVSVKHKVDMSNVYDSARMVEEYKEYIRTLKQNRFVTGINEIDRQIRGVAGGEVLSIIARSGSFKTAILQNFLKNYIDHSAWAATFFSIEMPVASLTERYLEILDGCTGQEVENLFTDPGQADIRDIAERSFTHELNKLFVVPTRVSLSDIAAYVQLIERERNTRIGVVGVDYLGLMDGPGSSEYEVISRLATGLKTTAKLLNIPMVMLAQTNRQGKSGASEISLDMGRGSGAIEESADFVLGLWQVENGDGQKALICKILKNRKGPEGSLWKLDLIPQTLQIGPNAVKYKPPKNSKSGF